MGRIIERVEESKVTQVEALVLSLCQTDSRFPLRLFSTSLSFSDALQYFLSRLRGVLLGREFTLRLDGSGKRIRVTWVGRFVWNDWKDSQVVVAFVWQVKNRVLICFRLYRHDCYCMNCGAGLFFNIAILNHIIFCLSHLEPSIHIRLTVWPHLYKMNKLYQFSALLCIVIVFIFS